MNFRKHPPDLSIPSCKYNEMSIVCDTANYSGVVVDMLLHFVSYNDLY